MITLHVLGVGLWGPGLASWATAQAALRGEQEPVLQAMPLPAPARLPPAERRRAGTAIRVAMAVADEAVSAAGLDPQHLATVFTSSSGEGSNCHTICETLASESRLLSPTRFTNSVHNAPAGYWHIAVASRAASTSLCAMDTSLAAGLLEAASQAHATAAPVLLVASDTPYPEPMHAVRPVPHAFGLALVLSPQAGLARLATLQVELLSPHALEPITACKSSLLETLRHDTPAARGLALLEQLAGPARHGVVVLGDGFGVRLRVHVDRANG